MDPAKNNLTYTFAFSLDLALGKFALPKLKQHCHKALNHRTLKHSKTGLGFVRGSRLPEKIGHSTASASTRRKWSATAVPAVAARRRPVCFDGKLQAVAFQAVLGAVLFGGVDRKDVSLGSGSSAVECGREFSSAASLLWETTSSNGSSSSSESSCTHTDNSKHDPGVFHQSAPTQLSYQLWG